MSGLTFTNSDIVVIVTSGLNLLVNIFMAIRFFNIQCACTKGLCLVDTTLVNKGESSSQVKVDLSPRNKDIIDTFEQNKLKNEKEEIVKNQ